MADLRPGEGDELITKGFLRAELAAFRGDLSSDLKALERSLTYRVYAMLAAHTIVVGTVLAVT